MSRNVFQKNLSLIILILSLLTISLPLVVVKAAWPPASPTSVPNPLNVTSFTDLAGDIITWIVNIGVSVAVIMIVYSALLFMTAAGSEEKVSKAKKALTWSLIGLAVLISSRALIELIKNILGAS
jgi:hypothetical protein